MYLFSFPLLLPSTRTQGPPAAVRRQAQDINFHDGVTFKLTLDVGPFPWPHILSI